MSPPPRTEAEDYWTSHESHGSKKKHLQRGGSTLRLSPFDIDDHVGENSAATPRKGIVAATTTTTKEREGSNDTDTILTKLLSKADGPQRHGWFLPQATSTSIAGQAQHDGNKQQPTTSPEEGPDSPAMTSLRRLSQGGVQKPSIASSRAEGVSESLSGAIMSIFTISEPSSRTRKQSIGDGAAPNTKGRRRSSAFRDGHRRLPKKDEPKPAAPGLSIPAVITLRKATGLFTADSPNVAPTDAQAEHSPRSSKDFAGASTISSLIAFNSRQSSDQKQVTGSHNEAQPRKQSTVSGKGIEFSVSTPSSIGWEPMDDQVDNWAAAPATTVADLYPSPAILTSARKSFSSTGSSERRVSVVQIKSRKSVHRVIWCEDDHSSSSGTSSDHATPRELIGGDPSDLPSSSENSPPHSVSSNSQPSSRQSLRAPLHEEQFAPDVLVESETNTPPKLVETRPGGQMFKWSWGMDDETPVEVMGEKDDTAKPPITADEYQPEGTTLISSSVPRLMVPEVEEPTSAFDEARIERRGSFMLDPSAFANIGPGRELGSRRSISVHPLALAESAHYTASSDQMEAS
ncbi:MAG: hypothetical protein LQ346_002687 [Caloplaca aetnensis]|nr:MAG: hypothetical protein LQ346_002687 [Caloplaca aetnensis]